MKSRMVLLILLVHYPTTVDQNDHYALNPLFGRIMKLVSIFVRILLVYNNIVACKKALNLKIPVLRLDFAVPGRLALTNDSC